MLLKTGARRNLWTEADRISYANIIMILLPGNIAILYTRGEVCGERADLCAFCWFQ